MVIYNNYIPFLSSGSLKLVEFTKWKNCKDPLNIKSKGYSKCDLNDEFFPFFFFSLKENNVKAYTGILQHFIAFWDERIKS